MRNRFFNFARILSLALNWALMSGCFVSTPSVSDGRRLAIFDHTGLASSCVGCHESKRPTVAIRSFDHTKFGTGDCVTCHLQGMGSSWSGGMYPHPSPMTSCLSCHQERRPVGAAGFPPFDHATNGLGDCVKCHTQNIGVNWEGAAFNHAPTPTTCSECHSSEPPAGIINKMLHSRAGLPDCASCHTQNIGDNWSGGLFSHTAPLTTCKDCHALDLPVGAIGTPSFDHSHSGTGDCVSCHKNPGVSWAGAAFTHNPRPTSCSDCHLASAPVGLAHEMDHSHAGLPDCTSCHTQNIGVNWTGGIFSHSPTPSSCKDCHLAERPAGLVGNPAFNHANGGTGDCVSCHKNPGGVWSGGQFTHTPTPTTCSDCHAAARPVGLVGNPAFNHANGGAGDCVSCHTAHVGVNWTGGQFTHSPVPSSCSSCHSAVAPAGISHEMAHSHSGLPDCASCHTQSIGQSWTAGFYNHNPTPTTCQDCHSPQLPAGAVGSPSFDHASSAGVDCKSCHTPSIGTSWAGGLFVHTPTPASCNSCHNSGRPATATYPDSGGTVQGHFVVTDCYSCHRPKAGSVVAFVFTHVNALNVKVNTCLPCHLSKGQHEHGSNVANCVSCHSSLSTWSK